MRSLAILLAILTPLAVLVAFQGMVTVGLVPLAVFGPFYAMARALTPNPGQSRVEGARMVVVAAAGAGLALSVALHISDLAIPTTLTRTPGLFLLGAGLGTLAGLTTAPPSRRLSPHEERQWTIVQALTKGHGRGLSLLFLAVLPAATLLALLRDAPLFDGPGDASIALPQALLADLVQGGYLALPGPEAALAILIPLSLAPIALGFLTPVRTGAWLTLGGLGFLIAAPVAIHLDLTITTAAGAQAPLSLAEGTALAAFQALAPAGAGLLLGAGAAWAARTHRPAGLSQSVAWAAIGALVVLVAYGWHPTIAILVGLGIAAVVITEDTTTAPVLLALLLGLGIGAAIARWWDLPLGLAIGLLGGVVAGSAAATAATTRSLPLPAGAIRSPRTLVYLGVGTVVGGLLAWGGALTIADAQAPFQAPHARALAVGMDALTTGTSLPMVAWGLAAGVTIQLLGGNGVLVGLGFLAGPGVAGLILIGGLLRSAWEGYLLKRAQKGWVMRGEMGYELLRVHVLVAAVLAGEALALGVTGWIG